MTENASQYMKIICKYVRSWQYDYIYSRRRNPVGVD
jgi:hypothetical protein